MKVKQHLQTGITILARRIKAKILLNGKDITADLTPFVEKITYEDCETGETDTLSLTLNNRDGRFMGEWLPPRGATLDITLSKINFNGLGEETLPLGVFEIEELTFSSPPSLCVIKANSCPENTALRQEDTCRAWEDVQLSVIAKDIAATAKVELVFQAEFDPKIKRAECDQQAPLAFLNKLCKDNGLALKFADGKLIIFDEEILERSASVLSVSRRGGLLKNYRITATLSEIYKSCEVNYKDGKASEVYKSRVETGRETGKTLRINQHVDTQADADRLAKKSLRDKNKEEIKLDLTLLGDFNLLSGNVVTLSDFGKFDGRYLIEKAQHNVTEGYDVRATLRKCLNET